MTGGRMVTTVCVVLSAAYAVGFGIWMWVWPGPFARFVNFPEHEHFLHDLGAYHLGVGVALLAALKWRDALAVVLAGVTAANLVHTVNHAIDLHLGGSASDPYVIGGLALVSAVGLVFRIRRLRATEPSDPGLADRWAG